MYKKKVRSNVFPILILFVLLTSTRNEISCGTFRKLNKKPLRKVYVQQIARN